jgi:hypothetical protein
MNRSALALLFAASTMLLTAPAAAATITIFNADLSGLQEVPPNASPASGFAVVTVDDALFTMQVQVSFSDLLGTTTASHIHCCAPLGTNVGVATQLPTFSGFPLGVTSGTYDHTFDMLLDSSYNPAFEAAHGGTAATAFAGLFAGMLAGDSYFNIHTSQFPGGEIRGQLVAVPEPSTWAMMLLGIGVVGAALRRRRRLNHAAA